MNFKRVLKNAPTFRDFKEEDVKYLWVNYKFKEKPKLSPKEFHDNVLEIMDNHFDFGWTLENKEKPIGVLFGISTGQWVHIVELNWFQWTTPREKLSSITNFLHKMRKQYVLTLTSNEKDKGFYNRMMDYGVLNRIGSMYGILKERAILYQTKYRQ